MSIEEMVVEKLGKMTPSKQREVLKFVKTLEAKPGKPTTLRSAQGLWAGMGFDITEEDIAMVRKEMWRSFPRDVEI